MPALERHDDQVDYESIADKAKAYAAILMNRHRLRAKQEVDKWLEECVEGSIGTLYKWTHFIIQLYFLFEKANNH